MKNSKILLYSPEKETIEFKVLSEFSEDNIVYSLFYSKGSHWTYPGSLIGTIKDNGNGMKVKIGDLSLKLDYSEAAELYHLLNTINKVDRNLFMDLKTLKECQEE